MVPCREAFTTVTSGNPREHRKSLGSQAVRLRPLFEPEPSRDWPEVTPLCGSSHPAADAPAPAPDLAAGSRSPVWRPPLAPHLAALGPSEAGTRARSQLGSDLALLPVPTPESSRTQEESRRLSMSCFYSTVIRILKKHQRPSGSADALPPPREPGWQPTGRTASGAAAWTAGGSVPAESPPVPEPSSCRPLPRGDARWLGEPARLRTPQAPAAQGWGDRGRGGAGC